MFSHSQGNKAKIICQMHHMMRAVTGFTVELFLSDDQNLATGSKEVPFLFTINKILPRCYNLK